MKISLKVSLAFILISAGFLICDDKTILAQDTNDGDDKLPTTVKIAFSGLAWLTRHQGDQGFWSCSEFISKCSESKCDGVGKIENSDAALTSMTLLAYLSMGIFPKRGPDDQRKCTSEAIKALFASTDKDRRFQQSKESWIFSQAICTQAVCEMAGFMGKSEMMKTFAEGTLKNLLTMQNKDGGWSPSTGKSDIISTAWAAMAIRTAAISNLEVPEEVISKTLGWIDTVSDKKTGKAGYTSKSNDFLTEGEKKEENEKQMTTTAAALCARIFLRFKSSDSMVDVGKQWLDKSPFILGKGDSLYSYFGTLAAFQIDGKTWDTWNEKLKEVLITSQ